MRAVEKKQIPSNRDFLESRSDVRAFRHFHHAIIVDFLAEMGQYVFGQKKGNGEVIEKTGFLARKCPREVGMVHDLQRTLFR